ncbi:Endoribonuclease ZC3H12A, partial [Geodia barretti]
TLTCVAPSLTIHTPSSLLSLSSLSSLCSLSLLSPSLSLSLSPLSLSLSLLSPSLPHRHGNGRVFSCRGIQIAVDWFRQQGHKEITVFVPQWRRETPRAEYPITDQEILNQLEREGILKFTPSRRIGNKKIVCYDDRFIVRLATETNGVIVSNDNFRDLAEENEKWRKTIENRLVMFTFAHDIFMVPEDPLGKYGPRLSQLLQIEPAKSSSKSGAQQDQTGPAVCPYGERCTFGRRCRFAHPEREGRLDPTSLLTSRSPTTSPAPSEKRHTDALGDIQKDGTSSHSSSERGSPCGPSGQPTTSPQRPWTSPAHNEINYAQQLSAQLVPHGYSQPQPSSGYPSQPLSSENHHYSQPQPSSGYPSQPLSSENHHYSQPQPSSGYPSQPLSSENHHYSHSQPHLVQPPPTPQYLSIPAGHGGSLSPPPPPHSSGLQSSPLHSNPSTPLAGGVSPYPSRTFPIANLSLIHSRNVTDRIQRSPIANGVDDLVPTAPSVRPIVPPNHGVMDSQPGLVPRGGQSAQFQGPPHNPSYNWSSANGAYHHHPAAYHIPHAQNSYHPPSHHYVSSAGDQLHHQRMAHHSRARNPHTGDYSTVPHGGCLPQPTNSYQNLPSSAVENGAYLQEHAAMLHQHGDYRYPHHRAVEPRAASMYGDMGLRLHHEKVALADKFQTSQSSPDLYCDNRSLRTQAKPSVSGGINWTLFRQVQSRLPNQEEQIMSTMLQHPQADLDQLVELIQRSW